MHMSLDTDFSRINLQYLLQVRDVARQEPDLVVALLGIPKELVDPLAKASPDSLSVVANIREPLVTLRVDKWWWRRFLLAINEGSQEEVDAVIEHVSFVATSTMGGED